eukprot:COSAG01_NODE_36252_length_520_cov_0.904988_1_plen_94_part_10
MASEIWKLRAISARPHHDHESTRCRSTCVQVGAACSLLLGEYAVEVFDDPTDSDVGYNAAFRFLGVVAICPVVIFVLLVGETAPHLTKHQKEAS